MGTIHPEVVQSHLVQNPYEESLLTPFLHGFNVNWARRRRTHNTWLSTYFLEPSQAMKDQFGFHSEVMLFVPDVATMQNRIISTAEFLLSEERAKGRVDQTLYFVVTPDESPGDFFDRYAMQRSQSRIPVYFRRHDLLAKNKAWSVKGALQAQLFTRNFFDYTHPLGTNDFFFGRSNIIEEFVDAASKNENRGLFGLRRTGKTSVLKRVKRMAEEEGTIVLFYDCKIRQYGPLLGQSYSHA